MFPQSGDPQRCDCGQCWFEDGTVVLQAEGTLFRAYSGILSRHSPVFDGLFQLPQPAAGPETYEGVPLVTLQDDSPLAVCRFLRALHDRHFPSSILSDASVVIDLLNMSAKYEASKLKEDVLKALHPYFPTTWNDWQLSCWCGVGSKEPFRDSAPVVTLANFFARHYPRYLPSALMILTKCVFKLERRLTDDKLLQPFESVKYLAHIDPPLKHSIHAGRFLLSHRARVDVYPSLFCPSLCWRKSTCDAAKLSINSKILREDGCIYPFFHLKVATQLIDSSALCEDCLALVWKDSEDGHQKLWDALPLFFDLPSWDVLLRDS